MASILVVDDNVQVRTLLGRLLETEHDVDVVATGEEAVARIQRQLYDLVITDLRLGQLDGLRVLAAARLGTHDRRKG